jgi:glutathione synthase/RimK-type ligase-like ATP-grasp enzyme
VANLAIYVSRHTVANQETLLELLKFRDAAEELGHDVYIMFPPDIHKIPRFNAVLIRSTTDPLNETYVVAKMAEMNGIPVIDDSNSIQICADKINMYSHLMKNGVPMPKTIFVDKNQINSEFTKHIFKELGSPLIIKEPSTAFSLRVEKVDTEEEFLKVAHRYLKLTDKFVVQEFLKSEYDWRIGVLRGKLLYASKYIIPAKTFKIMDVVDGQHVFCKVISTRPEDIPPEVVRVGILAGNAIGDGLYGVDLKETADGTVKVIEVNDNPSLEGGEDKVYPNVFKEIIQALLPTSEIEGNLFNSENNDSQSTENVLFFSGKQEFDMD